MENPNLEGNEENPQTPKEPEQEVKPDENPSEDEGVPSEEVDYKAKFQASTTENQRIVEEGKARDAEKDAQIADLELTLSEKELKKNPDYEIMTDEEKTEYKEKQIIAKDVAILKAKEKMREDYRALPTEVREKIDKQGGYEAFRDFACLPDNAGQKNLLNLAKSFLYKEKPDETPAEPKPAPGLESGSGGDRAAPPKEEGFTMEEIKQIRLSDPDRYTRLAQAGKLKIVRKK